MAAADAGRQVGSVNVSFRTKLADPLRLPEQPYVVPADLDRLGLSRVVNHLLSTGASSAVFLHRRFSALCSVETRRMEVEEENKVEN